MIAAFLLAVRILTPSESLDGYEKVPPPSIQMRMNDASATTVPWIDSNAWRYNRGVKKAAYLKLPARSAALAAAEAYAWGADAVIEPAKEDEAALGSMLEFLKKIDAPRMPVLANLAIVDDGSEEIPEVLNLLSRRNLLYRVVSKPDQKLGLNIKLGSRQFPRDAAANPNDFAARVREQISDGKRVLRLFGTYTVLANLTGKESKARLHLVNYSRRPVKDVRVRVLGKYDQVKLSVPGDTALSAQDIAVADGATEFTVPSIAIYAVVDLERNKN